MSYEERLKACKLEKLQDRWHRLFVNFANSVIKSERLQHWIRPSFAINTIQLRGQQTFHHPICRTQRYMNSAVNAIIRVANEGNKFKIIHQEE